ncbi:hypothetical protein MRX96_030498 [Rhipicephalus microplus]
MPKTNQFPLSLRANACALRHVERKHMTRWGKALVHRLLSLPDTGMGRSALEYTSLISGAPFAGLLPIPPHWDSWLPISYQGSGCTRQGAHTSGCPTTGDRAPLSKSGTPATSICTRTAR